jgi:phosphoglycolate phosphatase-like HAD superfamily hydrolase
VKTIALIALDIDGTLIDLTGAGFRAIRKAFSEHLPAGEAPEAISFAGSTDIGITREIFARAGTNASVPRIEAFFARYLELLKGELESIPYRPTPGALELVERLRSEESLEVGLATGNIRHAAAMKLASAGFEWSFDLGAFGDETDDRAALLRLFFSRAEARCPKGAPIRRFVLGDTPSDVAAAHEVQASAIAIACGPYDEASLRQAGADLVVATPREALAAEPWRRG